MKKIVGIFLLMWVSGFSYAQSGNMVIIKGTIKGDLKGSDTIELYSNSLHEYAIIKDRKYTISFPLEKPAMMALFSKYYLKERLTYQPCAILFSQPGTYYITSDISDLYHSTKIKGPGDAAIYMDYQKKRDAVFDKINNEIVDKYGEKWYLLKEGDPAREAMMKDRKTLGENKLFSLLSKFVKKHPDSYASAYALYSGVSRLGSLENKEYLFSLLSDKMKQSEAGKNFGDHIQGVKNSEIGSTVADFTLKNPDGKSVKLSDFKGKYVLVDFWASWCAPCRKSFPHMRAFYGQNKSDKFEIYSISIDESKDAWLKAVDEENNPWPQVLDDQNIAKSHFAVTAIPSTFLLDGNGKILAREVGFDANGGSEIERMIKNLAGNK